MNASATPVRRRLPDRRYALTQDFEFGGNRFAVALGIDPADGQPREIFVTGPKVGSGLWASTHDSAILTSLCLQSGMTLDNIAASMGRDCALNQSVKDAPPGSVIAAAVDTAAGLAREIATQSLNSANSGPSAKQAKSTSEIAEF